MRAFRMNPPDEEPARLLTEQGQWTEPWGSSDDGASCEKCGGSGRRRHQCLSCLEAGASDSCPACFGRVRWQAQCPVCRGSARIDGRPRHGVSAFPRREGLYRYMLSKHVDLEGCLVVELDAERAADVDFDADQGALLVIPTRIIDCAPAEAPLHRAASSSSAVSAPGPRGRC